jgi:hypothetical protein
LKKALLTLTLITTFANAEMIHLNDKEVVLDTDTKLVWQDNSDVKTVNKNWQGAIDYCENLSFAGFNDWKLPNIETLKALYPKKQYLTNLVSDYYWSSSSNVDDSNYGLVVNFNYGGVYTSYKSYNYYVRCVRDSTLTLVSFSSFLGAVNTASIEKEKVVLRSSRHSAAEFLVQYNGRSYMGTKDSISTQLGLKPSSFSDLPFNDIQKQTQENLNSYLTIATIPSPTLPSPLNLVKDEFETKAEFTDRVKTKSAEREAEIARLQEKYRHDVEGRNADLESRKANIEAKKKEFLFQNFALVMGEPKLTNATYDPETATMFVDVSMSSAQWSKKVGIAMADRNQAKAFKNSVNDAKSTVTFAYENDAFVLKNIDVDFNSQSYIATLTDTDYKPERVAVTLENKKVAFNELQNPNLVDKYQVSALGYSDSASAKGLKYNDDLAPLVKSIKQSPIDPKKWLFAIAVEKYDEADPVIYATNSANSFISVMQKRLGIDERHTYAFLDEKATSAKIKDNLERMLSNVKEGDQVYFYYSGHGIPLEEEAYILPKDKVVDFVSKEKEFMVRNIYKQLSDSKASKIVTFMDSCFSGSTDGISNVKGVAAGLFRLKKVEFDKEKMVVLTAGTSRQFSNAYAEKGNRLFSYYLTKAIATKENLDIDTLYADIYANVKEESLKMGDIKRQEPQIEGNRGIGLR